MHQRNSTDLSFLVSNSFSLVAPGLAGDVVVYEQPLLHVQQLKPSNPLYRPLQVRAGV
jgi:hypothetical protein